jgi:hypothetical protein
MVPRDDVWTARRVGMVPEMRRIALEVVPHTESTADVIAVVPANEVRHVAQATPTVEQRVRRLQALAAQVAERYLALALVIHEEHEVELWTKSRARTGLPYQNEEEFWEEALGVKRRTAYTLLAVGRTLSKLGIKQDGLKALAGVLGSTRWIS